MSEITGPAGPSAPSSSPAGASAPSTPGGDTYVGSDSPVGGDSGASAPVTLSDDTLVTWGGAKEPVKYGDLSRRLQAEYTRRQQAASKLQKQLEAERKTFQNEQRQERARLEQLAASMLAQRGGQGGGQGEWLKQLASKEYLSGADAAQLFGAIQQQGFGSVTKAFEQRDAIIKTMYNVVMQQQAAIRQLTGRTSQADLDNKLTGFVKSAGYDPEDYNEFARELYHAYEGEDLDNEFPEILKRRISQVQAALEKQKRAKVEAARKPSFPIPGKGGQGMGKPGGLSGRESSKQTADALWAMLEGENS